MAIFLLNTDNRLIHLHNKLLQKNYPAHLCSFEEIIKKTKLQDLIVLPPNFKWTVEQAELLPQKISLICGNVKDDVNKIFNKKNIVYKNLMED